MQSRFRHGMERNVLLKIVVDDRRIENKREDEKGETDLFDKNSTDDQDITMGTFVPSVSSIMQEDFGLQTPSSSPYSTQHTSRPSMFALFEKKSPFPTPAESISPTQKSSNITISSPFHSNGTFDSPTISHSQPPSLSPIINIMLSDLPTTSMNMNMSESSKELSNKKIHVPLQTVELVPFTILISADNVGIEMDNIRRISETHMTDTFDKLLSEQNFESVSLIITQGDDLKVTFRKNRFIYDFHGDAHFRTSMAIDERKVHLARMRAFDTENMDSFINLLRDSGLNSSSVSIMTLEKKSSDSHDSDDHGKEMDVPPFSRTSGDDREDENSSVLVRIGSISFAIASIAFIIGVFILYKMVKRMRDHVNIETAVALDSSVISQTGVESKTLSDQNPFPTSHSIYRIEEEESNSQEDDDLC